MTRLAAAALCAALLVFSACGKYGPPLRESEVEQQEKKVSPLIPGSSHKHDDPNSPSKGATP